MPSRDVDSPWQRFTVVTRARIALGRCGDAVPTQALLSFQYAHACARDAATAAVDFDALSARLAPMPTLRVHSAAADRPTYLRRPDLGRVLTAASAQRLTRDGFDAVFVIADGLSASAVQMHAVPMLAAVTARLLDWRIGPIILAEQARVALGDDIGARLGASMVAVLIGERPGLTAADSLGVYLTYDPRSGRRDSERNCISNIHADGLSYDTAARKLEWLMRQAQTLRLTGIALKEDAPPPLDSPPQTASDSHPELPCPER